MKQSESPSKLEGALTPHLRQKRYGGQDGGQATLSHRMGEGALSALRAQERLDLAARRERASLPGDELDREHSAMAGAHCRETRADSLGANSATGGVVDGFRAGTG